MTLSLRIRRNFGRGTAVLAKLRRIVTLSVRICRKFGEGEGATAVGGILTVVIGIDVNTLSDLMDVRRFFVFPDPVNETSARVVAGGVVMMGVAFLVFREAWILIPLVYGFAARVLAGPRVSPLGQISVRIATPEIERRLGVRSRRVPGPPKRFAQLVGL